MAVDDAAIKSARCWGNWKDAETYRFIKCMLLKCPRQQRSAIEILSSK